jgi:hypothetical protein
MKWNSLKVTTYFIIFLFNIPTLEDSEFFCINYVMEMIVASSKSYSLCNLICV